MEFLGKKRKGADILPSCRETTMPLTVIWSYFSLEDCSRQKKKCKEETVFESVGSHKLVVNGVVTAPPCGGMSSDTVARGLKRKIGCIDAATQLGRKKKIEEDYYLGAVIGQGKFGSVVLCQSKASGEEFACKTLCKGEEIVHREVEIMQHLSGHPGIVTLKSVYEDAESFYLVMELCPGGRLLDHMAREIWYSEQAAAKIIKELMLIIKYCHDMGVVHRDIKPENILLTTSGRIKLADFGLAVRVSNGQSLSGVVGSPAYVAPEVLVGNYSEKVDIWAAGVLLHALLVVSQPARDLIAHLLTRDLSARFTAEEVLSHPWILFYTEPTLKTLTSMPKMKNHVRLTSRQLTSIAGVGSERNKTVTNICLNDDSRLTFPSDNSTKMTEDEDEDFVDVLAMAISRVRISEPKRSRVCCPANPIQQECSSNMTVNNLCTAF
ncbi:serine/threonine-protein kinase PEPKR2-like isoform X2 [Diospyros lotus]|uniref:serine/threonine-protein kinase PEPKR2-like isoform X2 n=1 Tax=Diospyros lotus TaxID=55363 RepID=UPI00225AD7AF|nr:serine/threonine-protein kinase PEPKR2-like isoform X2 [Diospyros lotus]